MMDDATRQRLESQKQFYENIIEELQSTMLVMAREKIQAYEFESGEGKQKALDKKTDEMTRVLDINIRHLEAICNRLGHKSLVAIRLRRKL